MILLHIADPDDQQLIQIAQWLLNEKLVADVRIDTIRRLTFNEKGQLIEVPRFLLICKTKSLLFSNIVDYIRERLPASLPEIYALPLVSMERAQEDLVRSRTKPV
jgi:uncharacterized protein involved in tolerance to divalent cations